MITHLKQDQFIFPAAANLLPPSLQLDKKSFYNIRVLEKQRFVGNMNGPEELLNSKWIPTGLITIMES